ncbi:MAG: ABC transporter permease [Nitriliruptoraceae bacterium]|nr:ABC transporter permease [Nitriliruptoraceae bacterium]
MGEFLSQLRDDRERLTLLVTTLIVTFVLYQMLGQRVFSVGGMQSMSIQVSEFGFLALAMGLAMLTAGIDLSVVAAAGLSGVMSATVLSGRVIPITDENQGMLLVLGIAAALITGLLTGLVNGLIIAKVSVPPILATLGTMVFFTGIGMALTSGNSVPNQVAAFPLIANTAIGPFPVPFVMLATAFVVVALILSRTRFGRQVYLFGENQVALRFTGARTERVIILTYVLIGFLVGCAAIIMVARANSMRVGFGESYLLQAILVVVLSGFNPYGGKGRVSNLAMGLVLLQLLSTSMNAFAFSPYARNLVWGLILLFVMIVNHLSGNFRKRPRRDAAGSEPDEAGRATDTPSLQPT